MIGTDERSNGQAMAAKKVGWSELQYTTLQGRQKVDATTEVVTRDLLGPARGSFR